MTRQYFIDNIITWSELLSFCYEYDCNACENIISRNELCDAIADDFATCSHGYHWTDIRDWLNRIDSNCSYYYRDSSFEYTSVDGDFDIYKEEVLAWCDEGADIFEEDEPFDPFEDDILDLDDDYLTSSDTGSKQADDDISDGDMSMEDALAFLMDNMPYKITE